MKKNIKMNLEIEDGFIMNIIHEVFDRYNYNIKFENSDKTKEIVFNKFKDTHDDKNVIAREGYSFNVKTYVATSIRCSVTSLLWRIKKSKIK